MAASRDSASSSAYLGLGYAINIFVVLLLLNGIIRLVWGVLKLIQFGYLRREANYLAINKDADDEPLDKNNRLPGDARSQAMSRHDLAQLTTKILNSNRKQSYVSRIR